MFEAQGDKEISQAMQDLAKKKDNDVCLNTLTMPYFFFSFSYVNHFVTVNSKAFIVRDVLKKHSYLCNVYLLLSLSSQYHEGPSDTNMS